MQVCVRGTRSCPCNYWRRQVSCRHLSTWLLWTAFYELRGDVSVIWICLSIILGLKMIHLHNLTPLYNPQIIFSCYFLKFGNSWVCKMLNNFKGKFYWFILTSKRIRVVSKYSDACAIVWLNLYGCLNTIFSQYKLALWSALQRLSQNING